MTERSEPDLCRGWTATAIREAVLAASPEVQDILAAIATNPGITTPDLARAVGLPSWHNVGPTLGTWTKDVTGPMGVKDPATGGPSWPITFAPIDVEGRRFSRYYMTPTVSAIVLDALRSGPRPR